jgi:DeoR/GlpR family transcriptional regulator of sugar metabolism
MSDADQTASKRPGGRGPGNLVPVDRRHVILERVADEQTIHVGALARELCVSEMTIRRDIRTLERDGFLRQTYGGATAHLTRALDVAFNARALQHPREKRLIAIRAAGLIEDARTVFLGVGTTVEQFARYLHARPELTVVTASLPTASLLGTRTLRTISVGGSIMRDELTATGPLAVATLERYRFDVAVIGAAGLSERWGITELSDDDAEVQRAAIRQAERVIVLADGSKLGTAFHAVVGSADVIDTLVTDSSAPSAELEALKRLGVRVIHAGSPEPSAQDIEAPPLSGRGRVAPRS